MDQDIGWLERAIDPTLYELEDPVTELRRVVARSIILIEGLSLRVQADGDIQEVVSILGQDTVQETVAFAAYQKALDRGLKAADLLARHTGDMEAAEGLDFLTGLAEMLKQGARIE